MEETDFLTKSKLEKSAEEYPALYPFGVHVFDFLSADEERTAPFELRLRSSWRYMISRVIRFATTMGFRESASFDVEDIVLSVVEELLTKDRYWNPNRGRYITFLEAVLRNVLSVCHERARPVSGPTNSYARLRDYRKRESDGTLTKAMRATMKSIEQVMGDVETLEESWMIPEVSREEDDIQNLVKAVKALDNPFETWCFVRKHGIFGVQKMGYKQMAKILEMEEPEVRRIVRIAGQKVKKHVLESVNGEG